MLRHIFLGFCPSVPSFHSPASKLLRKHCVASPIETHASTMSIKSRDMFTLISFCSDESRFCFLYQDVRSPVCQHRGERTMAANIHNLYTVPTPGVMLWGDAGYTSRSPLVRIDGTLNGSHYISGMLRFMVLSFIQALQSPMFQRVNARPHVTSIVRPCLMWKIFGCSPGLHVHQISRY
ncbi:transposable element Tcb1 transposase [Trichonephila clavipes]|nr:transposable element Tcb1 transposase [Trichonephila clavipes]